MEQKFESQQEQQRKCNKDVQYGKKGRKPRTHYETEKVRMEDIVTNDISYWNKTVTFDNVTKFTWPLIVGQSFPVEKILSKSYLTSKGWSAPTARSIPPQAMVLDTLTGPGWAQSVQDGVNRSLALIMSKIRASLSTSSIGFETADLGIFLTSTASIPMLLAYASKIIRGHNEWMARNYVYPRGFYKMHGFDFDVELPLMQQHIVRFNQCVDFFNNMQIPDFSDIYDRQFALMHNVYLDEDSEFGQIYSFRPINYYKYDDTASEATYKPASFSNLSSLIGTIEDLLNAWYTSSDLFQINGVLLRAFKDYPRLHLDHISIDDSINPQTDREILMQIMNASIQNIAPNMAVPESSPFSVTQDPADPTYIKWTPTMSDEAFKMSMTISESQMLRLFENDVTKEDNMELTRLTNMVNPVNTANVGHYLNFCGGEIINRIQIGHYDLVSDAFVLDATLTSNYLLYSNVNTTVNCLAVSNFRYIPTVYVYSAPLGSSTVPTLAGLIGDIYNYMMYDRQDWMLLNNVALQSLWIPKSI